jgi:hypothetical protein
LNPFKIGSDEEDQALHCGGGSENYFVGPQAHPQQRHHLIFVSKIGITLEALYAQGRMFAAISMKTKSTKSNCLAASFVEKPESPSNKKSSMVCESRTKNSVSVSSSSF